MYENTLFLQAGIAHGCFSYSQFTRVDLRSSVLIHIKKMRNTGALIFRYFEPVRATVFSYMVFHPQWYTFHLISHKKMCYQKFNLGKRRYGMLIITVIINS